MRPSDFIDEPRPRRFDRSDLADRGTMRCEWCNKRTEVRPGFSWRQVDVEEWRSFVREHTPFFCQRENCAAHRRECMSSARRDKERDPRQERPKRR
jgi:hypothetical protein